LSWLERHDPETYQAILAADRDSRERYSGHGAAIAQAYNHLIMPLANERDRKTQVLWGLADFRARFGRDPEGMWLPETAVDTATLETLAEAGLLFTILAPYQAGRVRKLGGKTWQPVSESGIDPRRPYLCRLPSGREIALFFYDGPISRDVAFGGLLDDGERFYRRLLEPFDITEDQAQLVHIATDGETYGHHHRFGEMALAYCLDTFDVAGDAELTVYGEFLEKHPPTHEVEIAEKTSWSCAHGVERWRSDCGCRIGGPPGWTQAWRKPLRDALDWLRDSLAPAFEKQAGKLLKEPWAARDAYIDVVHDRSPEKVRGFLEKQAGRRLEAGEEVQALRLLELQRQAMLMYTSCGWFFDEISGLETTQILGYAGRALQLAAETGGPDLEAEFLARLEKAPSNVKRFGNGAEVYRRSVAPVRLDLIRVAAHHAIVSIFAEERLEEGEDCTVRQIYCYHAESCAHEEFPGGRMKLAVGQTRIRSNITWNSGDFAFAVLHMGGHTVNAGVRPFADHGRFEEMRSEVAAAFEKSDIAEVIRTMDRHFGSHTYSLWHLFKDEQRKVLEQIMAQTLDEVEDRFRQIYEDNFTLMRFLREIGVPIPKALAMPVEQLLVARFRRLLESGQLHPNQLRALAEEVEKLDTPLDDPILSVAACRLIEDKLEKLAHGPQNLALLLSLDETLEVLGSLPLELNLWRAQNLYWRTYRELAGDRDLEEAAAELGKEWLAAFTAIGRRLGVRAG
jgi:alpha-amylase/alpha-mannosidase (GH57 family)